MCKLYCEDIDLSIFISLNLWYEEGIYVQVEGSYQDMNFASTNKVALPSNEPISFTDTTVADYDQDYELLAITIEKGKGVTLFTIDDEIWTLKE